jgi:protein SCO1
MIILIKTNVFGSEMHSKRKFIAPMILFLLTSCIPEKNFKNVDIADSTSLAKTFHLEDADGKIRTLADFRGKVVVMLFGYTYCPDFCPTTLIDIHRAMNVLGAQAEQVQVIFVTVDPARDTASILKQYVPVFDKRFLGLRPKDDTDLAKLAKDFKIYYKKVPGPTPDTYTMDHTARSYAFDPEGHLRLYINHANGPDALAHDLRALLN